MKRTITFALLAAASWMMSGCWFNPTEPLTGPATSDGVIVMNGGGSTFSVIDLEEDTVYNDVAVTGVYANQISLHNGKVYCVNSGSSNISINNGSSWAAESPVSLPLLSNPMEMAWVNDSVAVVTSLLYDKLYKINMNTKTVIDTAETGDGPTPVAVSNGKIYVGNTAYNALTWSYDTGTVTVYDEGTLDLVSTVTVGSNPQAMAVDADGNVHVLCTGNYVSEFGSVHILNSADGSVVKTIDVGRSPGSIALDDMTGIGYAGSWGGGVVSYDPEAGTVLNDSSYTKGGVGVMVDEESIVWIASWGNDKVYKYDEEGALLDSMIVGDGPQRLLRVIK